MRKYRFGDFEVDLDAVQLCSNGERVKLERRPLDLLILLVSRSGALITREELVATLWPPKTVIDFETGLNTLVRKVRGALGDSSEQPQFIETVPGRGYRFIAPVDSSELPGTRDAEVAAAIYHEPVRVGSLSVVLGSLFVLLVATAAAGLVWQASREPAVPRLAVLPFDNLTGDDGLDYLAWGLGEDTKDSLSQIDELDLSIVGGFSARAAMDPALPLSEIGRKLDATFLVRGALTGEGANIRLTTQLIRVADDEVMWRQSLDRVLTNISGLQRELAIAISEQVRQRLSPQVAAAIARRQTQSPEAYGLYLNGRHAWNQLSRGSVRDALAYFDAAVAKDPSYALAWVGIAHTLITAPITSGASRQELLPRAREAMAEALRLGPDLAEVQYTLGYFRNIVEWDPAGAEQAARRAVELDRNNPMARMFLGMLLSQQGHYTESLASLRRARELDPMFALVFANSALVTALAGDSNTGLELARQAVAIGPEIWATHYQLGNVQMRLGNYRAALEAYVIAERYSGGNSLDDFRAVALARLGRESEARALLANLTARSSEEHVSPLGIARVYVSLGESDAAFQWIELGLRDRDVGMLSIQHNYPFDTLSSDPRFEDILRRRNLSASTRVLSSECAQAC